MPILDEPLLSFNGIIADVSFPFSRRVDRASERANEVAWGEQKIWGELGRGEGENGGFTRSFVLFNSRAKERMRAQTPSRY